MTRLFGRAPVLGYAGVAGALFLLTGCDALNNAFDTDAPSSAEYAAVCVDQNTGNRAEDDACGDYDDEGLGHSPGSYWLWMPMNSSDAYLPRVGQRMPANSPAVRSVPKGTPISKGAPAAGGKVNEIQRNGFGPKKSDASASGSQSTTGGGKGGAIGKGGSTSRGGGSAGS